MKHYVKFFLSFEEAGSKFRFNDFSLIDNICLIPKLCTLCGCLMRYIFCLVLSNNYYYRKEIFLSIL